MAANSANDARYDALLTQAAEVFPGVDIGRPVRSRMYRTLLVALRGVNVKVDLDVAGKDDVLPGAGILAANHQGALDPVVALMSTWWHVVAFTKAEWFEGRSAVFFRWMGQIPLRRGDEASTAWALEMASLALDEGAKIGIYPEGTRGPSRTSLYKLHQRVLIPLIEGHPDAPVYAVATTYPDGSGFRRKARVRFSPPLPIDPRTMSGDEIVAVIRDALVELGDLTYVDVPAFVAKARADREAGKQKEADAGPSADD
jgi:1-acyl-sn-glycerol-3-phosphate acyltransferase